MLSEKKHFVTIEALELEVVSLAAGKDACTHSGVEQNTSGQF